MMRALNLRTGSSSYFLMKILKFTINNVYYKATQGQQDFDKDATIQKISRISEHCNYSGHTYV